MRYVGFAALAATFWLTVATVRLMIIHDDCAASAIESSAPAVVAASEVPATVSDENKPPRHEDVFSGSGNGPMSRAALVKGLNDVKPRVAACYRRYHVPGTAVVNVVIAKRGRVSSAVVTGKFAGTPTGACVEAAVKTARFPPSDGFSTPYPFQLR